MHRITNRIAAALAALLLTGGIACVDAENFRADVIHCEDALSHAMACCPRLAPPETACVYHYETGSDDCGCMRSDSQSYYSILRVPVLTAPRSDEIAAASCEELTHDDGCAALAEEFAADNLTRTSTDCDGSSTEY